MNYLFTSPFKKSIQFITLVFLTVICALVSADEIAKLPGSQKEATVKSIGKPVYYPPGRQRPLRVSQEEYQNKLISLKGLSGVYLDVDGLLKFAGKKEINLTEGLKQIIKKKLNAAGMRLLTKVEMENTPGQPELSMFTTYPKHLGPFKKDETPAEYRADCCSMGIWTSFSQGAATLRDPLQNYKLGTWGKGFNTSDCSDPGGWMSDSVLNTVDEFIKDKVKGDTEYSNTKQEAREKVEKLLKEVTTQTPAETGSMECNTSLMMYVELFKTGQTTILPSKFFILNKLAESMNSCPLYHYVIETHADARASDAFNERLSERRADSIKNYLVSKGVDENQFELLSFGESRPIALGITEEDYAANRRVVVTPFKVSH